MLRGEVLGYVRHREGLLYERRARLGRAGLAVLSHMTAFVRLAHRYNVGARMEGPQERR